MTTQVTKIYEKDAVIGANANFSDETQLRQYIEGTNCVTSDINVAIKLRSNLSVPNDLNVAGADSTRRIRLIPFDGMAYWQMGATPAQWETAGIEVVWLSGRYGFTTYSGLDYFNLRIRITDGAFGQPVVFSRNKQIPIDNDIQTNYIIDETTTTAQTIVLSNAFSEVRFDNNICVIKGVANKIFLNNSLGRTLYNNTFVGRDLALNAVQFVTQQYAGGSVRDTVFINGGPEFVSSTVAVVNCFANKAPTAGALTGFTVVAAPGGLVDDTSFGFIPAAGGPVIDSAGPQADNTTDATGKFRGTIADSGAVQRTAFAVPVIADATVNEVAQEGRRAIVKATFTNSAVSALVELRRASDGVVVASKPGVISGNNVTAQFDLLPPIAYLTPRVTMKNTAGGTGASLGNVPFTVAAPNIPTMAITSVMKQRRNVKVNFTWTGAYPHEPISADVSILSGGAPAVSKGPIPAVLNANGTGYATISNLQYGTYTTVNGKVSNSAGDGPATAAGVTIVSPALAVGAKITDLRIQNTSAIAQANAPFSWSHLFKEGDIQAAGAAVQLVAPDNTVLPVQLNVLSTNAEGSVRQAMLHVIIPNIAASAEVQYNMVRVAAGPAGAATVPADIAGLAATVLLTPTGKDAAGPVAGSLHTADVTALLAAGTYTTRYSGPIASEWIVRAPAKTGAGVEHIDLAPYLHIRGYKSVGKAKLDFIVENNWIEGGASPYAHVTIEDYVYRLDLKIGNTTVRSSAAFKGYTQLQYTKGTWDPAATGLANDATVYTASFNIDGVTKAISITGSQAQTFAQLRELLLAQTSGLMNCYNGGDVLTFESKTTGANSFVRVTYGSLFPMTGHSGNPRPIYGDEMIHYMGQRKKWTHWLGAEPTLHVIPNRAYRDSAKALPYFDPTLAGSPAVIASNKAKLANAEQGSNGLQKPLMREQGYAEGIGLVSGWAAMYLVNGGKDAYDVMMKMGDLGGSFPIALRERETGQPISLVRYPYATYSPNAGDSVNPATGHSERIRGGVGSPALIGNKNIPDVAHHPSFFYTPYLASGDYFYFEALQMHARWVILTQNSNVAYRDGAKSLFNREQSRGTAWALRTMFHAHWASPDTFPLKDEIKFVLDSNRQWFTANYVNPTGQFHNNLGVYAHIETMDYSGGKGIGLFQDDFNTAMYGHAVELGYDEWMEMFKYKAKSPIGRMTSGSAFCFLLGASGLALETKASASGPVLSTWADVGLNHFGATMMAQPCGSQGMVDEFYRLQGLNISYIEGVVPTPGSFAGYPGTVGGYSANAQPAIAYTATHGLPSGADAFMVFESRTVKPNYNDGPQFAIVPREPDAVDPTDPVNPPSNGVPFFSGTISNINGVAGAAITPVNVSSRFSDTDSLSFSESPLGAAWPAGLGVNSSTAVINGTSAGVVTATGVRVRAMDTIGQYVDSNAFNITITASVPTVTSVTVSPANATINPLAQQQFTATVSGTYSPSQVVEWTKTGGGTLTSSGLFSAPSAAQAAQIIVVTATSAVDPTKFGSSTITIAAALPSGPPDDALIFTPSVARTITVEPAIKPFTAGTLWTMSDPKKPRSPKDGDSTIDYTFNWTPWLLDAADSIATHEILLTDGLVNEGSSAVGGKVTVFVSSGAPNKRASITCRVTTTSSPPRVEDRTIFLDIEAA